MSGFHKFVPAKKKFPVPTAILIDVVSLSLAIKKRDGKDYGAKGRRRFTMFVEPCSCYLEKYERSDVGNRLDDST